MSEIFRDKNLKGAVFANVALAEAKFDDVNLGGAAFSNVNMTGIRIDDANLSGAVVTNSRIDGMTIDGHDIHALLHPERTAKGAGMNVAPVLPVRDIGAAIEHYRALGFKGEPYRDAGPNGPVYGFVSLGSIEMHLSLTKELDPASNTAACYLYVDDAERLYRTWVASGAGGRYKEPVDTPYGLREFVHWDPDGNLLRVGSSNS
jgi:hypothetical protein